MAVSQAHITASTPIGASLVGGGATFRIWAPAASSVHVAIDPSPAYQPTPADELVQGGSGFWAGFIPGVVDGTAYQYFVVGPGGAGFKRDPRARELQFGGPNCIVRDPAVFPWHDEGYRPPAFEDLIVYQFHVGVFYARDAEGRDRRAYRAAKLLDALDRVEYLVDLGVNAIQPLPLVEFHGEWSLGYNGVDIFSPETDYCVSPAELGPYLQKVNVLLAKKGRPPLTAAQLAGQDNQLKAFVDVCHLYSLAVLADVVYNHAGAGLDAQSLDYLDFPDNPNAGNSLYFSAGGHAGGKIFAYDRPEVESFLIDNARMLFDEYHVDGFRFDQVTIINDNGGKSFCQDLTGTLRYHRPSAPLIAEFWGAASYAVAPPPGGLGFDLCYSDLLRRSVRGVLSEAAVGAWAPVHVGSLRSGLERPWGVPFAWQVYNSIEDHDLVLDMPNHHTEPRIAELADGSNHRSWYACSRARVATGLLLTAPGVPMMFMGQEFLEDKLWSDNFHRTDRMIWWDGLDGADPHMGDFHRCVRDLTWLRRRHPALRAEPVNVYRTDEDARVLAFHRWVPGAGRDVVVVASLSEFTVFDHEYALGFPISGVWHEVLNTDLYQVFPNPDVRGNAGQITADGPALDGLPTSSRLTLPANTLLVFARDLGD
jgi:1,4-alpha-glucan branching enzyme